MAICWRSKQLIVMKLRLLTLFGRNWFLSSVIRQLMNDKNILILGAGVSGLSTGILLLKEGYNVHIQAKDLPPNTTSNIAAAFWYPYLCNPRDKVTKWSGFTLQYLKKHALNDPDSG